MSCRFESKLTDYDVCSNWGNWVHAAGLTGGRVNKFNISKQSRVRRASLHRVQTLHLHAQLHVPLCWRSAAAKQGRSATKSPLDV